MPFSPIIPPGHTPCSRAGIAAYASSFASTAAISSSVPGIFPSLTARISSAAVFLQEVVERIRGWITSRGCGYRAVLAVDHVAGFGETDAELFRGLHQRCHSSGRVWRNDVRTETNGAPHGTYCSGHDNQALPAFTSPGCFASSRVKVDVCSIPSLRRISTNSRRTRRSHRMQYGNFISISWPLW